MTVTLTCPRCGTARSFLHPPISECPRCQTPYPDELRRSAEARLAHEAALEAAPRPAPLTVGMYLSTALGAMCLLVMACAAVDVGEFYINEERVSGPEFLALGGLPLTVIGLLALAIAYSLSRELWWSRPLILVFWIVFILMALVAALAAGANPGSAAASALLSAAILLGPTAAYLFFKGNVVAYYDARRAGSRASGRDQSHGV